ncbi:MAG: thiamine pyrophosphate-dependent enzyme [Terricaulis sp.]|nr:thiamine pyrophosphate-dependent enzyme [Terricaulis sp.]
MATTLKLPMLFYIEDNGYGISTPGWLQTPGCNIAKNLANFEGLTIFDGDGTEPTQAAALISQAVAHVRGGEGPALLHLNVPRLQGHSFQDTQTYKSEAIKAAEWARDPLPKLKAHCVPSLLSETDWEKIEREAEEKVRRAAQIADQRPVSNPADVTRHVFSEAGALQDEGGLWSTGYLAPKHAIRPHLKARASI